MTARLPWVRPLAATGLCAVFFVPLYLVLANTFKPGDRFHRMTNRSASLYGSGRSNSAFVTLKMALFAPMPMAKDKTATIAKAGLLNNARTLYHRSCHRVSILHIIWERRISSGPATSRLKTARRRDLSNVR